MRLDSPIVQQQAGEQARFGGKIPFVAAMVIQVLVGDVGDHGDVEVDGRYPMLRQSMRRRFQNAVRQTGVHHAAQVTLHHRRFRRSHVGGQWFLFLADHRFERA